MFFFPLSVFRACITTYDAPIFDTSPRHKEGKDGQKRNKCGFQWHQTQSTQRGHIQDKCLLLRGSLISSLLCWLYWPQRYIYIRVRSIGAIWCVVAVPPRFFFLSFSPALDNMRSSNSLRHVSFILYTAKWLVLDTSSVFGVILIYLKRVTNWFS